MTTGRDAVRYVEDGTDWIKIRVGDGRVVIGRGERLSDGEWVPVQDSVNVPTDVAIAVARAILELAGERSGECHRRDCPVCDGIEG